jgi:hypothetical protein
LLAFAPDAETTVDHKRFSRLATAAVLAQASPAYR